MRLTHPRRVVGWGLAAAALLRPALFQHQRVGIRLDDDGVTHNQGLS